MSDNIARFGAAFDSTCDSCGSEIYEDDPIGYDKDERQYICQDCIEERTQ